MPYSAVVYPSSFSGILADHQSLKLDTHSALRPLKTPGARTQVVVDPNPKKKLRRPARSRETAAGLLLNQPALAPHRACFPLQIVFSARGHLLVHAR